MTAHQEYQEGDIIYSRVMVENDGGVPGLAEDALFAVPGTRGVVLRHGHIEEDPGQGIYLVRFENQDGGLGPPVGVLAEELTQDRAEAIQGEI